MSLQVLGKKNGELWWQEHVGDGKYKFISEYEMVKWAMKEQHDRGNIIAAIYNKAFNNALKS